MTPPFLTPVLAHPLTEPGGLGLPPVVTATAVVVLSTVLALRWPRTPVGTGPGETAETAETAARGGWVPRALGVALLVAVVVAGRLGRDSQVDNIAPSLAIGVVWPLMLAAGLTGRRWWDRVNPFDTLARGLAVLAGDPASSAKPLPGGRLWALPSAVLWVYYLGVSPSTLEPRVVGAVLGGYTLVTLAACLAVGRRRWMAQGELFTVLFDETDRALRPRDDEPWAGADLVVAVLAGGFAFATLRLSDLWFVQLSTAQIDPLSAAATIPGLGVTLVLFALLVRGGERWLAATGGWAGLVTGSVALAAVGIGLAQGFIRERFAKAAILVVARLSNPLGGPTDWFGTADLLPGNTVFGDVARVSGQLVVLVVAATLAGVMARRHGGGHAQPALVVIGVVTAVGVLAVTAV